MTSDRCRPGPSAVIEFRGDSSSSAFVVRAESVFRFNEGVPVRLEQCDGRSQEFAPNEPNFDEE